MTDSTVSEATRWLDGLLSRELAFYGDTKGDALDRLARRLRQPRSRLWALCYRPPKEIAASLFVALKCAYDADAARERQKLESEILGAIERARINAAADPHTLHAAIAVYRDTRPPFLPEDQDEGARRIAAALERLERARAVQ